MMKNQSPLQLARAYEREQGLKIPANERPMFHLTPLVGWMNDPNGFSWYQGQYHLFYQYYPYDTVWNDMHWGHAVSKDLLHWTYLPAALAPDEDYDADGCFSGSALEMPDGRHLLMYTSVRQQGSSKDEMVQTQSMAVGDGVDYRKYENNPVLDERDLPAGKSRYDFRDPKMWREPDGSYRCVVGSRGADKLGAILLYASPDGFQWKFESTLIENDGRFGQMWECPDFYELDGRHVLAVSPQDMMPEGFEFHNGNGTLALIGTLDREQKRFTYDHHQSIDYGIDFYAPQTTLTPDGRRVMIGWMQNWDTCNLIGRDNRQWFGQMSLPRELSIRDGRLYQQPIRELEQYRSGKVEHRNVRVEGELSLAGIEGRMVDLELVIRPQDPEKLYQKFAVRFAQNGQYRSAFSFRPHEGVLKIDRKFSGSRRAIIHQRRCLTSSKNGEIRLRLILDRFSAEAFINDGEQVMTATISTDPAATGISFYADGPVKMDVVKYDLFAEET